MAKLFGSLAVAALFVGCGGVEESAASATDSSLREVEQKTVGGCDGGLKCDIKCSAPNTVWTRMGTYPQVPDCQALMIQTCQANFGTGGEWCWSSY